jgi:hypothetical protein
MWVPIYQITERRVPEDHNLNSRRSFEQLIIFKLPSEVTGSVNQVLVDFSVFSLVMFRGWFPVHLIHVYGKR